MRVGYGIGTQASVISKSHVVHTTLWWQNEKVRGGVWGILAWSPFYTLCCQGNIHDLPRPSNKGQRKIGMSLMESSVKSYEVTNLVFLPYFYQVLSILKQLSIYVFRFISSPHLCLLGPQLLPPLCFHSCQLQPILQTAWEWKKHKSDYYVLSLLKSFNGSIFSWDGTRTPYKDFGGHACLAFWPLQPHSSHLPSLSLSFSHTAISQQPPVSRSL